MKITAKHVASFHYTLKNDEEKIIDSSLNSEPLSYLHGAQNIVPGLEKALEGKSVGDKLSVSVNPEEGYGEYDDKLKQELPRSMFSGVDTLEVGMEFHAETQHGQQVVSISKVEGDTITVDGNHPLAGQTLHFDVEVTDICKASDEELEQGHALGSDEPHH